MNFLEDNNFFGLNLVPTGSNVLFGTESSDYDYIHLGKIPQAGRKKLEDAGFWEHDSYLPWVPSDLKCFRHYTEEQHEDLNWDDKHKQEHDVDIFEMHPLYYEEYIKHFNYVKCSLADPLENLRHSAFMDHNNKRTFLKEKKNYTSYINTRMVRFITNELSRTLHYKDWANADM